MTDAIQGLGSSYTTNPYSNTQSLTDQEKADVKSILSQYGPSGLTAADAKAIVKSFKQDGIQPGQALQQTISADGYDPAQIGSLAGHGHHHHHGQGQAQSADGATGASGVNSASLQALQSILSQYDLANTSSDQSTQLSSDLADSGLLAAGSTVNLSA
jgi:hypothetical protein